MDISGAVRATAHRYPELQLRGTYVTSAGMDVQGLLQVYERAT
jgi:hypothetical protein